MTDDYIYPENMNSARRLWLLARFMYPTIKKQLWLYPAAITAYFIAISLVAYISESYTGPDVVTSLFFGSLFYFAPVVLSARDNRLVISQLPVTAGEKMTFLYLYFWVAVPVLLVAGTYIGLGVCMVWGNSAINGMLTEMLSLANQKWISGNAFFAINFLSGLMMMTVTIYPMVSKSNNRILHSVVSFFAMLFAIALVSGVAGFAIGFYHGLCDDPRKYTDIHITENVALTCSIISLVFEEIIALVFMRKTYKKLRNCGF